MYLTSVTWRVFLCMVVISMCGCLVPGRRRASASEADIHNACGNYFARYSSCDSAPRVRTDLFMSHCKSQLGLRDAIKASELSCGDAVQVGARLMKAQAFLDPLRELSNCASMCRFATTCSATFNAIDQCTENCESGPNVLLRDDYERCQRATAFATAFASAPAQARTHPPIAESRTIPAASSATTVSPIWKPLAEGALITARIDQCKRLPGKGGCPADLVNCWQDARTHATNYTAEADEIDRELKSAHDAATNSQVDPLAEWRAYPVTPLTPNHILSSCARAARVSEAGRERVSAERFRNCITAKAKQQPTKLWYASSVGYVIDAVLGVPALKDRCGQMYPLYQAQSCFQDFVENAVAISEVLETAAMSPADPTGSLGRLDATIKKSVGRGGCRIWLNKDSPVPFDVASVAASIEHAHKILEEDAVAARRVIAEHYDKSKQRFADWGVALAKVQRTASSMSLVCRDAASTEGGLVPQYFADCMKLANLWPAVLVSRATEIGIPVATRAPGEFLLALRTFTLTVADVAIPSTVSLTASVDLQRKVDALQAAHAAYLLVLEGKQVDWDKATASILKEEPSLVSTMARWKVEADHERSARETKEKKKLEGAKAERHAGACDIGVDGTIAAIADLMGEVEVSGQPAPVTISTYAGKGAEISIVVSAFSKLSGPSAAEVAARFVRSRSSKRGLGLKFAGFRTKCSAPNGISHVVVARMSR